MPAMPVEQPGFVTNALLCTYFSVCDDKRREAQKTLWLPARRKHAWTEVWAAVGLAPEQRRKLWPDLQEPLLTSGEVAALIDAARDTINGWCRQRAFPAGFPPPIVLGPSTRRWIRLEILAYRQPSLYAKLASDIRRPDRRLSRRSSPAAPLTPLPTTLDPLPDSLSRYSSHFRGPDPHGSRPCGAARKSTEVRNV